MSLTNDIVIQLAKFNDTGTSQSNAVWDNHTKQTVTVNQGDQIMISKAYVDTRSLSSANIVILEDTPLELEMYYYWINDGNPGSDALGLNNYNFQNGTGSWYNSPVVYDEHTTWVAPNYTVQMTLQSVPNIAFTTSTVEVPTSTNSVQVPVYADGRPYLLTTTDNKVYTQTWKYTLPAGTYSPDGLATLLTTAMAEVKKDTGEALQKPNAVDWFDKNSVTSQLDQPFIVNTNSYPPIWSTNYLWYNGGQLQSNWLINVQPYLQIQANSGLPPDWYQGTLGSLNGYNPTEYTPGWNVVPVQTAGKPPVPSLCFKNIISDCPTNPVFLPETSLVGPIIPASSMGKALLYKIITLGNTNWILAGDTQHNPAQIGDSFVCQQPGTIDPQNPYDFGLMVVGQYYTIAYLGLPFENAYDTLWLEMGATELVVGSLFQCTDVLTLNIKNDLSKMVIGINYTILTVGNVDWNLYGASYKYPSLTFNSRVDNGPFEVIVSPDYPKPALVNWNNSYLTGGTFPPLGPTDNFGQNLNFCMPGIMDVNGYEANWLNFNIGIDSNAEYLLTGSTNYIIGQNLNNVVIKYPGSIFGGVNGINDCILTVKSYGPLDCSFPAIFPTTLFSAMYFANGVQNTWGYYITDPANTPFTIWEQFCVGLPDQIVSVGEVGWMFTLNTSLIYEFDPNTRVKAFLLTDYQPGYNEPDHFIGDNWEIATGFTVTGNLKVFNEPLFLVCSKIVTPVPAEARFTGFLVGSGTVKDYEVEGTVQEYLNPNSPNYYLYPLKLSCNPLLGNQWTYSSSNDNTFALDVGGRMLDFTFPVVGSTEIELAFNDQANRFQWSYTHSPILQATAPATGTTDPAVSFSEVVGIVNSFVPDTPLSVGYTSSTCKLVSKSGVMFRSMNPPSFWQGILGFSPDLLVTDTELGLTTDGTLNPIDFTTPEGQARFTYERFNSVTTRGLLTTAMNFTTDSIFPNIEESYIPGMFYQPAGSGIPTPDATAPVGLAYSSVLDKWWDEEMVYNFRVKVQTPYDYTNYPSNTDRYPEPPLSWNQTWYQALNTTVIIPAISGPTLVADEFGHYLLEVQGYEGGGMLNEIKKYNTKSIISSYYVNPGSFCTQPFPDPQIYTHVGEPMTLNNFKVRILNPNTMEEVGGLLENSCVYLQINKVYSEVEQTQLDSS